VTKLLPEGAKLRAGRFAQLRIGERIEKLDRQAPRESPFAFEKIEVGDLIARHVRRPKFNPGSWLKT
jgi:hypothetical protein